jgi:hypothetical protein
LEPFWSGFDVLVPIKQCKYPIARVEGCVLIRQVAVHVLVGRAETVHVGNVGCWTGETDAVSCAVRMDIEIVLTNGVRCGGWCT